jgi:hypothetical protein
LEVTRAPAGGTVAVVRLAFTPHRARE